MAEFRWRGFYPPHEFGARLALQLDLSLSTGKPPSRILDAEAPDEWTVVDLEVVAQWKAYKENTCPGCGRPLHQHLHNPKLGREETVEDYIPHTLDCPSMQAIAQGQDMWKKVNKQSIDGFSRGNGPDPGMGVYWLSQGPGERLPEPKTT